MTRILTGVVGVLIMIPICIFSGSVVWPLFITLLSFIAVNEMLKCIDMKKEKPFATIAYVFSFLPLAVWLLAEKSALMDPFRCLFVFCVLFALAEMIATLFRGNTLASEKLYSMIALILYVVASLTAMSQIRFIDHGNEEGKLIYLLVFVGAWFSDTFAYFVGRAMGKHKLCPKISPKKTVEGSIGGILANMIAFAGYSLILRSGFHIEANVFFFAVLGALFSVVGQFGDLFASAIKRHFNIKDYGTLFPGHGGVLDRFDSTLAISLVMYTVYAAFGSRFLIG